MMKVKMIKAPIQFHNWINLRKINLEKDINRKLKYADVMRIISMTKYIPIDDEILRNYFKNRRKEHNVFI